jgi:hypothetical protein
MPTSMVDSMNSTAAFALAIGNKATPAPEPTAVPPTKRSR